MRRNRERDLDSVLDDRGKPSDDDLAGLAEIGRDLRNAFAVEVRPPPRERALFASSVAATRARGPGALRFFVPAFALMIAFLFVAYAGSSALPGDVLFPVRRALSSVGLAKTPLQDIDGAIARSTRLIASAEAALRTSPRAAERFATHSISELYGAYGLLDELEPGVRANRKARIGRLLHRCTKLVVAAELERAQEPPGRPAAREDNSGPGGAERSGSDDSGGSNSGPGGGDDSGSGGDDNSGPGGGDDSGSGSEDGGSNSGPGGGDDSGSGGDDNSGPGGGDDSGSGSRSGSNSGPGGGDDSGSGSRSGSNSGPGGGDGSGSGSDD